MAAADMQSPQRDSLLPTENPQAAVRGSGVSVYFDDNKSEVGHGRRSLHGGAISLISRAVNAAIQVGAVLFLARLLSPEDYGLVSMVSAITGFAAMVVDLGTRDAIVQRPRISEGEISALFWITLAVGLGFASLVAICGPLIAQFYGEPRLTMIAVVSAVTCVAAGLSCQHQALLRRAMKFQELGAVEICANLFSAGLAITLALYGFHYWALVLRPVLTGAFFAMGVWLRCPWLPPRPTMTSGVTEMVKFGLHTGGYQITDFGGRSIDRVAIGYRSGATPLGYYQNAMLVYENLLDVLGTALHGVSVASLSKVRDDPNELRRLWGKAVSTLAFYAMPLFGILAVTSQDVIVLLLGAKWSNAGMLLRILAFRGIPHSVERTVGWLHVTAGRSDRWMRWGLLVACAQLVALFSGLPFGPTGVVSAYVICTFVLFIPGLVYAGRPLDIGAPDVIKVLWRPLTGALMAAAVGEVLRYTMLVHLSEIVRTGVLTLAYVTVYLLIVVGLFRLRSPIHVVLQLMSEYWPARFARGGAIQGFMDEDHQG